jgi:acetyltransferase-like isoleucine patch superfamily enzyme
MNPRSQTLANRIFAFQSAFYVVLIYGLPAVVVMALVDVTSNVFWRVMAFGLTPFSYAIVFVVVAGALSIPHQRGIVPGKFPRSLGNPIYRNRRLYGLCWTALYYFKPIYYLCVTLPALKALTFRLFGYRGNLDFTIYADTWIRDLPLLSFGRGSYIGNRATVGSNQCFGDRILVDRITFDEGSELGHLAMVSPGVRVGKGAVIGVAAALGLRTRVGANAAVGGRSTIGHGVTVGASVRTGVMSYIDDKSLLADEAVVAPAATVMRYSRRVGA